MRRPLGVMKGTLRGPSREGSSRGVGPRSSGRSSLLTFCGGSGGFAQGNNDASEMDSAAFIDGRWTTVSNPSEDVSAQECQK
jgi:hypothetical protein